MTSDRRAIKKAAHAETQAIKKDAKAKKKELKHDRKELKHDQKEARKGDPKKKATKIEDRYVRKDQKAADKAAVEEILAGEATVTGMPNDPMSSAGGEPQYTNFHETAGSSPPFGTLLQEDEGIDVGPDVDLPPEDDGPRGGSGGGGGADDAGDDAGGDAGGKEESKQSDDEKYRQLFNTNKGAKANLSRAEDIRMRRYFAEALGQFKSFKGLSFTPKELDNLYESAKTGVNFGAIARSVLGSAGGKTARVAMLGHMMGAEYGVDAADKDTYGMLSSMKADWDAGGKEEYAQSRGLDPEDFADSKHEDIVNPATGVRKDPAQPVNMQTGAQTRGIIKNAGGGMLDTRTTTDAYGNDTIVQGPQSVETATKTIRAKLPAANGEMIDPNAPKNLQSDVLFEAFSWVPDGYGLGVNNRLHVLNKQHDNLRFGMERLDQPRAEQPYSHPHAMPAQFMDSVGLDDINDAFNDIVDRKRTNKLAQEIGRATGSMALEDDMMSMPSSKGLARTRTSPFVPVHSTIRAFLPWKDGTGLEMNQLAFSDSRSGTLRKRKLDVYNVNI